MSAVGSQQDEQRLLDSEEIEMRLKNLRRAIEKRDRLAQEISRLTRELRQAKLDHRHACWDLAAVQTALAPHLPKGDKS